mmetsp:Transcript_849/g.1504  ORF Transcript_849/g.1504 Transcript_849/m.1504 type:complete len:334 (+) Transcript_849:294-1295(+)
MQVIITAKVRDHLPFPLLPRVHERAYHPLPRQQPVLEFLLAEHHAQLELLQVFHHQLVRRRHVLLRHGPQSRELRPRRQLVQLLHPRHGHPRMKPSEPDLHQLFRVQRPMVIPATRHVSRQHHPGRVHGLEHARVVHPPRDLLDEDRSESLRTELLVHAQEVHLDHVVGFVVHANSGGDARDEGHEAIRFGGSDAEVEFCPEAGRGEGPREEVAGVVESEHAFVVLDVVLVEEVVYFGSLGGVGDVDFGPLEALGHVVGIGAEFGGFFVGDDGFVPVGIGVGFVVHHGACVGSFGLFVVFLRIQHGLRIPKSVFLLLRNRSGLRGIRQSSLKL